MAFTFLARLPQLSINHQHCLPEGQSNYPEASRTPLPATELEDTTAKCKPLLAPHIVGTRQPPAEDTPTQLPRGVTSILPCSRSFKVKSKARTERISFQAQRAEPKMLGGNKGGRLTEVDKQVQSLARKCVRDRPLRLCACSLVCCPARFRVRVHEQWCTH